MESAENYQIKVAINSQRRQQSVVGASGGAMVVCTMVCWLVLSLLSSHSLHLLVHLINQIVPDMYRMLMIPLNQ